MADYSDPKRGVAYRFTISLFDRSTGQIKTTPTLAAGDVKVSKDNGATANITTLPSEAPASSGIVQVDLSGTEMTADIVTVVFRDASGAEWNDVSICLTTAARQMADLAYPTTSGRSMDVDANGGIEVGSFQAGAITAAAFGAGAIDNAAIAADAIGSSELAASAATEIATAVTTALGTGTGLTAIPWNAAWDAEVQSEAADALSAYDPPTKAELDAAVAPLATAAGLAVVDAIADKLDTALELDGAVYRFTTNALEQAPTGGSAPTASAIADEVQTRTIAAVTVVNGLAANTVTASALAADAVTEIQSGLAGAPDLAAVKAKTDNLPTDPADQSLIIAATDAIITAIDAVPTNAELATALAAADDAVLAAISTLSGAVATVDTVVDALAVSLAVVDGLVDAMTVRVSDMWQLQGLDGSNPAVFTPAAFDVGTIHINVTGDGTATTTLTRTT